ncbi:hypothetical protein F383_38932 [Gossypium arboreum]|uniref:Uncharacterized protein n=1 Tax=Gossypium arboreum TaxID=29729 RepID=A0A0B0MN50_GOSAR|nr:hypothetical protein F383_38932 [Gossypium arboreum]
MPTSPQTWPFLN